MLHCPYTNIQFKTLKIYFFIRHIKNCDCHTHVTSTGMPYHSIASIKLCILIIKYITDLYIQIIKGNCYFKTNMSVKCVQKGLFKSAQQ